MEGIYCTLIYCTLICYIFYLVKAWHRQVSGRASKIADSAWFYISQEFKKQKSQTKSPTFPLSSPCPNLGSSSHLVVDRRSLCGCEVKSKQYKSSKLEISSSTTFLVSSRGSSPRWAPVWGPWTSSQRSGRGCRRSNAGASLSASPAAARIVHPRPIDFKHTQL